MVESADLTEPEREAIHEVERGAEWIHRAHGLLVAFHHAVAHAMDHFDSDGDFVVEAASHWSESAAGVDVGSGASTDGGDEP